MDWRWSLVTWRKTTSILIRLIIQGKEGMEIQLRDALGVEDPQLMATECVQEGCLEVTTALIPVDLQETFILT